MLRSDRALLYVLLHGDDELGTGWTPAWIDRGQAEELLAFLRREIVTPAGYELIPALERRMVAAQGKRLAKRSRWGPRRRSATEASKRRRREAIIPRVGPLSG